MPCKPTRALALLTLLMTISLPLQAGESTEPAFKAAFLYYFSRYTEWPVLGNTFHLCILGQDTLGKALEPLTHKDIAGRPIVIQRVERKGLPADCNLLYITATEHEHLPEITGILAASPVLTVAEAGSYPNGQVMLRMRMENGILVFDANAALARKAGLTFSAKMLRLAHQTIGVGSDPQ